MKKNRLFLILALLSSNYTYAVEYTKFNIGDNGICIQNEYIKNSNIEQDFKERKELFINICSNNNKNQCLFPENISSLYIANKNIKNYAHFNQFKIGELKGTSYYNHLTNEKIIDIKNDYISVKTVTGWSIIKSNNKYKKEDNYKLDNEDYKIASCIESIINTCIKTSKNNNYVLEYRIWIHDKIIPDVNLEEQDKKIDSVIKQWDCEKVEKDPNNKEKTLGQSSHFNIMDFLYGKGWCKEPACKK